MSKSVVVFGEMLWDLLPTGKQAGGAPMNVALHLNNLGIPTRFISRIGTDELGQELMSFVAAKGLDLSLIQQDPKIPTGVVNVRMDDKQEVVYDIVQPSAWDHIEATPQAIQAVKAAEMVVFESLANRHQVSRHSLEEFLQLASTKVKVFDTNLRPPFYDQALLEGLLKQTDILKINHHELEEVSSWLGVSTELKDRMKRVAETYEIKEVIATRGANGAAVLKEDGHWAEHPGYKIEVEDTIGSGDSFLASYLTAWLEGKSSYECLSFACALGAIVATHKGANPPVTREEIEAFIQQNS